MPTQQTTYNSRVTDEALEKKFRDTFKSQGGAELVDDLYASGVIVPIVDFTAAAQGSELRSDLQTASDFATTLVNVENTTSSIISTPGFWKVDVLVVTTLPVGSSARTQATVFIDDSSSTKSIFEVRQPLNAATSDVLNPIPSELVVFMRTGDVLKVLAASSCNVSVAYRQIADVNGNLVNPLGFTSS